MNKTIWNLVFSSRNCSPGFYSTQSALVQLKMLFIILGQNKIHRWCIVDCTGKAQVSNETWPILQQNSSLCRLQELLSWRYQNRNYQTGSDTWSLQLNLPSPTAARTRHLTGRCQKLCSGQLLSGLPIGQLFSGSQQSSHHCLQKHLFCAGFFGSFSWWVW